MTVFERVVVGVDGTDFGFEALHQTLTLSPPGEAVLAVTALDTPRLPDMPASRSTTTRLNSNRRPNVPAPEAVESSATDPTARRRSCEAMRKASYDMSAMSTTQRYVALGGRSSSRFLGIMTGETASTLLHDATRSVLFARPQWGQRWHPNRVVVGLDGSDLIPRSTCSR